MRHSNKKPPRYAVVFCFVEYVIFFSIIKTALKLDFKAFLTILLLGKVPAPPSLLGGQLLPSESIATGGF